MFGGYKKQDWIIAALICLLVLAVTCTQLTCGIRDWGDDWAAYILEGIAISEGDFHGQTVRNYTMHGTYLSEEASDGQLVYVWGFPLLLSVVHKFVGFDTVNFSSIFFYKLPSLICFALTGAVLYLLYRRYFSSAFSAVLTLLFCISGELMQSVDLLNVDIPFLFLVVLSLLLAECMLDAENLPEHKIRAIVTGLGLGVALWLTHETRLNGFTVVVAVFARHLLGFILKKEKSDLRRVAVNLIPYLVFLLLTLVSEAILAPATQNISHVGKTSLSDMLGNIYYYYYTTVIYIKTLTGDSLAFIWPGICLLLLVGFFADGFRWKNLHMTALLAGTYFILFTLPYVQGLRYLFYVLPIIVLYIALGAVRVYNLLVKKLGHPKVFKACAAVACAALLLSSYIPAFISGTENVKNFGQTSLTNVYAPETKELFHFIQENVEEDALIGFIKPRALYLNTGRTAFIPNINSLTLEDADYFLYAPFITSEVSEQAAASIPEGTPVVFESQLFTLYKLKS